MTVIVEDGSIVPSANSLVSVADYALEADSFGVVITGDEEVHLLTAMEFINAQESALIGSRVSRDQGTAYPRNNLVVEGWLWLSSEIPRQAQQLQIALAIDINEGIDLYNPPEPTNKTVKRERVEGAVEVEYAVKESSVKTSRYSRSRALLSVLTRNNGLKLIRG